MSEPVLAAFSDVHGHRYMRYLRASLPKLKEAEIVLMAGDIVEKGEVSHCRMVLDALRSVYQGRVIAIFGNEEYDDRKDALRQVCEDVTWLDDDVIMLDVKGRAVAIVGSRGILDTPTRWQERNVPDIRQLYAERLERLAKLLNDVRRAASAVVLLLHYAPLCLTLEGEDRRIWSQMGSRALTKLILRAAPTIVLHGHAHNSLRTSVQLGSTAVYNVALPATKSVTLVRLIQQGLDVFL